MRRTIKLAQAACLGALVCLAGCVSLARTEPPQEYYVLGAEAHRQDGPPPGAVSELTIGLRRLKLASYLASPFMVVRLGANQVDFAEFHRWGESLEAGIDRVVADGLVAHGFGEVVVSPWPAQARPGYVIQLEVVRFEGLALDGPDSTEGGVLLLATWEITRQMDGSVVARGTTDYQRPGWRIGDYPGLVTLLDSGLGVVADDLAVALAGLPPVTNEPGAR